MIRYFQVFTLAALMVVLTSCGGSSNRDNSEAVVYLTVEIEEYNPDIDICTFAGIDVSISAMVITSHLKDPTADVSSNQDVQLTRWSVRPYRTDGGATASPEWAYDLTVYVPVGGEATLENYRVFPAEYFNEVPLSYLLPENGGFDPETGNHNIRQTFEVQLFGRTNSGKTVSTDPIPVAFNFFCVSP